MRVANMDLDLEVFQGPFDLLLTLVLKEEVDLLEVDLAEIVLAYVDHLERSGLLDLRAMLRSHGRMLFDDAVKGADRVTEAVTLFALLELYKAGEADWEQEAPFAPITIEGKARA